MQSKSRVLGPELPTFQTATVAASVDNGPIIRAGRLAMLIDGCLQFRLPLLHDDDTNVGPMDSFITNSEWPNSNRFLQASSGS